MTREGTRAFVEEPGYRFREVPPDAWRESEGFWADRLHRFSTTTLPHVLATLEIEGRYRNFDRAAGLRDDPLEGHFRFDDSDVYKAIEGAAYQLARTPDPELESQVDAAIACIARAQDADGYLFTWHQARDLDTRWTDMDSHEMYCGGHLMEAAVAYYGATGKRALLDVACRVADHYLATFGPEKRHWVDGHEEVGLGLIRLASVTHDNRYRDFAHWHIEERGQGHGRGSAWERPEFQGARYAQDHVPVREIRDAEGHAVRAMYLYAAMTDLVGLGVDPGYRPALDRAWSSIVERKMYVTGGIGAVGTYEGFGPDFFLPNREAYCETCAAIGMVLWAHRMNRLTGQARYADVIERELYNGVLAGLSLSGDRFFYENPLESDGTHHRAPWFSCACCPSNVARFLPQVASFFQVAAEDGPVINQFAGGETRHEIGGRRVRVVEETGFPFRDAVRLTVFVDVPMVMAVRIRKPDWASSVALSVNGQDLRSAPVQEGYLVIDRTWTSGDEVSVQLPLSPRRLRADPRVEAARGRVALARGPVVYCLEEADNPAVGPDPEIRPEEPLGAVWMEDLLGGVPVLRTGREQGPDLCLIPYYAWDNRDPGFMRVWLRETE